ncbi:MAG: cell wall hydrolase [Alphaproteobacteria bacterium]|nr:MAG: cell wall hydrolase [Alphaproteobacteria bacterium]
MMWAKIRPAAAAALICLATFGPSPSNATENSADARAGTSASAPAIADSGTTIARLFDVARYMTEIARDVADVSKRELAVSRQYRCLAQAVYFEARGEPVLGQMAVAHVVLNRVRDRRYPNTICAVVFQNEHRRNRCQFSFACDGRSDRAYNMAAWNQSLKIALKALAGASEDITNASTHYHATYVAPYWASSLKKTVQFGQHLFYREVVPQAGYSSF